MPNVMVLNACGFTTQWTLLYQDQSIKLDIENAPDFLAHFAATNNVEQVKIAGAAKSYGEEIAQAIAAVASTVYNYKNLEIEVL